MGAIHDRAKLAVRAARTDPRLLLEYSRWAIGGLRRQQEAPRRPPPGALSPAAGRALVAGRNGEEGPALSRARSSVESLAREVEGGSHSTAAAMAGDPSLGELLYALVRRERPEVVIETGVATGITSAYVLAGLADNGRGVLHSIDLPGADLVVPDLVGAAVPTDLRDRWTYHWGTAKRHLPGVLRETANRRRTFVHDSDHSYANMRWELDVACEALAPGEWIVADDVDLNDAFADVAGAHGLLPQFIAQEGKPGCTGLMQKREPARRRPQSDLSLPKP